MTRVAYTIRLDDYQIKSPSFMYAHLWYILPGKLVCTTVCIDVMEKTFREKCILQCKYRYAIAPVNLRKILTSNCIVTYARHFWGKLALNYATKALWSFVVHMNEILISIVAAYSLVEFLVPECSSGEDDSTGDTGWLRFTGMDKGVRFLMKRRLRTKTLPLWVLT